MQNVRHLVPIDDTANENDMDPMARTLEAVQALHAAGLITVPAKPTAQMLAAGSQTGSVSVETAWRVYQAMVDAAAS